MTRPTPTRRVVMKSGAAFALAPVLGSRASADEADPTDGRAIAFDESFAELDTTFWNLGPKATTAEPGFYGRSAFAREGGEEGFDPYAIVEDDAAENGTALQLSARYIGRPMSVPNYYGNDDPEFQWVSGNVQMARRDGTILGGWRRGYFEARMRMPSHPLTWAAFWLMNAESILAPQTSVEIDIVEHKGFEPQLYGTYLHEWGGPDKRHEGAGVPTEADLTKGYFRYGVLLEGNSCRPYFERQPVLDPATGTPIDWPIERSARLDAHGDVFWPLLTLALRADVPFPSPLQEGDKLAHLRIDYFRVFH